MADSERLEVALVHRTKFLAEKLIRELGLNGVVEPISPHESQVMGKRFDKIIVLYDSNDEKYLKWYNECLVTTLKPGGSLIRCSV